MGGISGGIYCSGKSHGASGGTRFKKRKMKRMKAKSTGIGSMVRRRTRGKRRRLGRTGAVGEEKETGAAISNPICAAAGLESRREEGVITSAEAGLVPRPQTFTSGLDLAV